MEETKVKFNFNKKTLLLVGAFLALLASIFLTVYLLKQKQELRSRAYGVGIDLDVIYIERQPRYNFDDLIGGRDGWPQNGELITFIVHIKNQGSLPSGAFSLKWFLDNQEIKAGTHSSLAPKEEATETYQWRWDQGKHTIKFVADPQNQIPEISKTNNSLEDRTNALSVGFWVEREVFDFFNRDQYLYCQDKSCAGSNSWEDWAQRQIKEWNRLFETANPLILERVRIDKLIIVNNCALPLGGGDWPNNIPDKRDKTVDLMWGFTTAAVGVACPNRDDPRDANFDLYHKRPEFKNLEYPLMHELSHALHGLPDQYVLNVYRDKDIIETTDEQGRSAWDYFPPANQVYTNKTQDLMANPDNHFYREYNIYALNSFVGKRNQCTNYNPNNCWPLVTSNLPTQNVLRIIDRQGNSLPGARIKIFQMRKAFGFHDKKFINVPDFVGVANNQGLVEIGHNPFRGNNFECGVFRSPNECLSSNNWLLLLMIIVGSQTEFQFFEYTEVNIAYWKSNISRAIYDIKIGPKTPPTATPTPTRPPGATPTPTPTPTPTRIPTATPTVTRPPTPTPSRTPTPTRVVTPTPTTPPGVTPTPTIPPPPPPTGDYGDNTINIGDYNTFLSCLRKQVSEVPGCEGADLNDDGVIDSSDFLLLFESFQSQYGD